MPDQLTNLERQLIEYFGVYAKSFLARECLTAELQENALINFVCRHLCLSRTTPPMRHHATGPQGSR